MAETEAISLRSRVLDRLVGQDSAVDTILPYLDVHTSGLAPTNRPVGVFLLLGCTGSGKTYTVESLAAALHGSEQYLLRIDCAEFQLEHEVAKLVGAPPGYLGHRETVPFLTQSKLTGVTSGKSPISIVLFDEVEKAAPSFVRLLLGVLDRGILRLGDGGTVNFNNSLVFMTSNLGAKSMTDALSQRFGFGGVKDVGGDRIAAIGKRAAAKKFSPEFMNRLDAVIAYGPLTEDDIERIYRLQMESLQERLDKQLGDRTFLVAVTTQGKQWIKERGFSREYGARALKRVIHQSIVVPVARLVLSGCHRAGEPVRMDVVNGELRILEARAA